MRREQDDIYILHAEFCGIFANDKRLRILDLIGQKECSVGEIAEATGMSSSNVSQHLMIMRRAGVVTARKEGRQVLYSCSNRKFIEGYRLIREGLAEVHSLKAKMLSPEEGEG